MNRFFLLPLCLIVLAACKQPKPAAKKQDSGPIKVPVAHVRMKQVQRVVESVGTLYPYDEVLVSAEIEGKVDQVNVDLGDRVNPGQTLVHISDEEQRYILAQNEAQLRMSLERLGLKNEADRSPVRLANKIETAYKKLSVEVVVATTGSSEELRFTSILAGACLLVDDVVFFQR